MLQDELKKNPNVLIPLVKKDGEYKQPLYDLKYAYSHYRTFGNNFNKFRILDHETVPSIPIVLHEAVNGAKYKDHFLYATCNGRLCLSAIWPSYYLRNQDVQATQQLSSITGIPKDRNSSTRRSRPSARRSTRLLARPTARPPARSACA